MDGRINGVAQADPEDDGVSGAVEDVVIRVAEGMERDLDVHAVEVKELLEEQFPEMRGDRQWVDLMRASVASNVETTMHVLRHGIPADGLPPPAAAAEYARRLAQHAVPMEVLGRAYHMGMARLQDEYLRRMTGLVSGGDEPPVGPEIVLAAVRYSIRVSNEYVESVTAQLEEIYEDERARWHTGVDSTRIERVRSILAGDRPHDAAGELRYELNQTHLAVVLWVPEGTPAGIGAAQLERAAGALRPLVRAAGPPLCAAPDELSLWAWYPLEQVAGMMLDTEAVRDGWAGTRDAGGPGSRGVARGAHGLGHSPLVSIALGTLGQGQAGFRRSHEHAQLARSVATMAGRAAGAATGYDEPGLSAVAMLCRDVKAASVWVAETLGPLAEHDETAARLRETIRMFYRHGASHKSAASALHLHPNTVKYRIRRAEEMLGRPLQPHRGDVELAVSICYWMGPEVLTG